ncbi:Lymphoid-Specific Helicase [Manis pentadactyla]|nr:Lymphoid-Specific Helicase [Manis pentadactyla]
MWWESFEWSPALHASVCGEMVYSVNTPFLSSTLPSDGAMGVKPQRCFLTLLALFPGDKMELLERRQGTSRCQTTSETKHSRKACPYTAAISISRCVLSDHVVSGRHCILCGDQHEEQHLSMTTRQTSSTTGDPMD